MRDGNFVELFVTYLYEIYCKQIISEWVCLFKLTTTLLKFWCVFWLSLQLWISSIHFVVFWQNTSYFDNLILQKRKIAEPSIIPASLSLLCLHLFYVTINGVSLLLGCVSHKRASDLENYNQSFVGLFKIYTKLLEVICRGIYNLFALQH